MAQIRTVILLSYGILLVIIGTPVVAVCRLFDRSGKIPHHLARWHMSTLSRIAGVRITLEGRENLDRRRSYLIMVNHNSSADILVTARALPIHFKFFAASFLFPIPFFGWCMAMAGYLPINRADRTQARASLKKGTEILRTGQASLLIFPEGTRGEDNEIQDFKLGFMRISTLAQQPILPVVIAGTGAIKSKYSFWYRPGKIRISILPPVPTQGLTEADWDRTKTKFEKMFREEYARIR